MTKAQWKIGDALVTRIDETTLEGQGRWLLPGATPDIVSGQTWLDSSSVDQNGDIRLAVHSFVIDISGTRIVVDTGIGNAKVRDNPAWNDLNTDYLQRLCDAGIDPGTVDLVLTTHIHRDHVGWNTMRSGSAWVPTFANAEYLVALDEWEYWTTARLSEDQYRMFADSVDPVRDAGLLRLLEHDELDVADGVQLIPTPGHTPGHRSVRITSGGASALITGDFLHHPIQLAHPCLECAVDIDPALALRTRATQLASLVDTPTLLLGTHFTSPTGGYIRSGDTGYVLSPADSEG
ncbi:MAG: MBL fold metallo-hydrolase [Mycolicibacterium neoaurum]|uniref:MBL fold metallo-hydrolase n=1 Tax=Mycolicibacterium neoaurum TaxID=1795 RepID=UPI002FF93331